MKKLLLAIVGLSTLALVQASASDLPPPSRMPPPRAPAYVPFFSWNGFYLGANVGYGFGTSNWTASSINVSTGDFSLDGWQFGGTLGYNIQMGQAVFGIETDFDWSGIKGSTTNAAACAAACETKNTWMGTLRGRLGYAFDRYMPYITGGMAYGNVQVTDGPATANSTHIGWTLGGGGEYYFTNNWSGKLEYLYVDLGNTACAACAGGVPFDVKFTTHLVRGGINYKF